MPKDLNVTRYQDAAACLPVRLRKLALALPEAEQARAEEFRLRAGSPLTVLLPEGEMPLEAVVEPEELETLCDLATSFPGMPPQRPCGRAISRCGEDSGLACAARR